MRLFTNFILAIFLSSLPALAQTGVAPKILRSVSSETVRDLKSEKAIRLLHKLGDEEKDVRYYYNRVDLNGDKKPEVIVYPFRATFLLNKRL